MTMAYWRFCSLVLRLYVFAPVQLPVWGRVRCEIRRRETGIIRRVPTWARRGAVCFEMNKPSVA